MLSKTFFRRNTVVFQGKMVQLSAKRTAVRVRWQLGECTPGNRPQVNLLTCGLLLFDMIAVCCVNIVEEGNHHAVHR